MHNRLGRLSAVRNPYILRTRTGHILWWQRLDKLTLYVLLSVLIALLLIVIVVCIIIICICRKRRRQNKCK